MDRRTALAVGATCAALVLAGVAAAATGAAAQTFRATGKIAFTFQLTPGSCKAPPNPANYKAHAGPARSGLCFTSNSSPPLKLKCPAPGSISGTVFSVDEMSGLRVSPAGVLHVKAWSYTSGPKPIGYSELYLKVSGTHASGYVRETDTIGMGGAPLLCDSGKVPFTAHA